jgi:hypothetical protein
MARPEAELQAWDRVVRRTSRFHVEAHNGHVHPARPHVEVKIRDLRQLHKDDRAWLPRQHRAYHVVADEVHRRREGHDRRVEQDTPFLAAGLERVGEGGDNSSCCATAYDQRLQLHRE